MNLHSTKQKQQWTNLETELLQQNFQKYQSKKWKKLSELFKSHGYNRSEIQIRQRWDNYDNPSLIFAEWTLVELKTLYQSYKKYGTRWCLIRKTLPGRTQNKIKNKIYGNIRIFLRFVISYITKKREEGIWINKISPNQLINISRGHQNFQFFEFQIERAIQLMNYKIQKILLVQIMQQKIQLYNRFASEICKKFDPSWQEIQRQVPIQSNQELKKKSQTQTVQSNIFGKCVNMDFSQSNYNQTMANYLWIPYYNSFGQGNQHFSVPNNINFWREQ